MLSTIEKLRRIAKLPQLPRRALPKEQKLLLLRKFGEVVDVVDRHGKVTDTGRIVGRSYGNSVHYDIETPDGVRLHGIAASRLRDCVAEAV
jgi:hypothetical protein